jgi:hypothetical protein
MIAAQNGHAEAALLLHRLGADLHAGRLEVNARLQYFMQPTMSELVIIFAPYWLQL